MIASTGPIVWSRAASADLTHGLLTPFTWSILSRSAERAVRAHYHALGYDLPTDTQIWRRHAGRAYLNTTALTASDQAFSSADAEASLGQRLLGRGGDRRQAAVLNQQIEAAPATFDAIQRWCERVQGMQWRQATILQIMEEIEPKAEAVLTVRDTLTTGLGADRRQITRWVAEWLPGSSDTLFDALFAGLDGREGWARYRFDLRSLVEAARQEPAALAALQAGEAQSSAGESAFGRAFESFLVTYRHWGEQPLEAASPRWSESPRGLLERVRRTLDKAAEPLLLDPDLARQRRAEAGAQVAKQAGLLHRRQFEPVFNQLQAAANLLPASRDALVTVIAVARIWALGAAQETVADGRLGAVDDVFLLELEELKQVMTGEWSSAEQVLPLVEQRRAQQIVWAATEPPEVIED